MASNNLGNSPVSRTPRQANEGLSPNLDFSDPYNPRASDRRTTLQNFDGGSYPVHSRGVSVRQPEIISLFEFRPIFQEANILTPEGLFIDTALNARKFRVNDLKVLFEKLTEDPESGTGRLATRLIEALDRELRGSETDVGAIQDIANKINLLLSSFDFKNNQFDPTEKILQLRANRFGAQDSIPGNLQSPLSFLEMLGENLNIRTNSTAEFSNTKLLLLIYKMIASLSVGVSRKPNLSIDDFGDRPLIVRENFLTSDNLVASPNRLAKIYRVLDPAYYPTAGLGRDARYGNLARRNFRGGRAHPAASLDFLRAGAADNKVFVARVCALAEDFSMSSALGNNSFMDGVPSAPGAAPQNIIDSLFLNGVINPRENTMSKEAILNDRSFTGVLLAPYRDKFITLVDSLEPQSLAFETLIDTASRDDIVSLTKPAVSLLQDIQGSQGESEVAAALSEISSLQQSIPSALRKSAERLLFFSGNDQSSVQGGNVLTAEHVTRRMLESFDRVLDGLNLNNGNVANDTLLTQLATFSEAYTNGTKIRQSIKRVETGDFTAQVANFTDLLSIMVTCVARSSDPGRPSFFDLIPEISGAYNGVVSSAQESEDSKNSNRDKFSTLAASCANAVKSTLVACPPTDAGSEGLPTRAKPNIVRPGTANPSELAGGPFAASAVRTDKEVVLFAPDEQNRLLSAYVNDGNSKVTVNVDWGPDEQNFIGTRYMPAVGYQHFNAIKTGVVSGNILDRRLPAGTFRSSLSTSVSQGQGLFGDIVGIMEELYQASLDRCQSDQGGAFASNRARMLASGTQVDNLIGMLVYACAYFARELVKIRFVTVRSTTGVGDDDGDTDFADENDSDDSFVRIFLEDVNTTRNLHRDIKAYLAADGNREEVQSGPLRTLLNDIENYSGARRKIITDFCDFMTASADNIDDQIGAFIASFVQEDRTSLRTDLSFENIREAIAASSDYSQLVLSRKKINDLKQSEDFQKYFDNFLTKQGQENYLYTCTRDTSLMMPAGDNKIILAVGIPFGFTQNVLGLDPMLDPQGFLNNRKVDIVVRRKELLFGGSSEIPEEADHAPSNIECEDLVFRFDLNTFVKDVQDPVISSTSTEEVLNLDFESEAFGQFNYEKSVTSRQFPPAQNALQDYLTLTRINPITPDNSVEFDFSSLGDESSRGEFKNHAKDFLAKTYVRLAYGVNITEESFFLRQEDERKVATQEEIEEFKDLINSHLADVTGQPVTLDTFLSGDRQTRELVRRLKTGERTRPIVEAIDTAIEGVSPDGSFIASEDLVIFSRMLSDNNPFVVPTTTRQNITKPKLFERVFCIMIDPDEFKISNLSLEEGGSRINPMSAEARSALPDLENYVRSSTAFKQIKRSDGLPQASQYDVFVRPVRS
jgi:hypothetical protein